MLGGSQLKAPDIVSWNGWESSIDQVGAGQGAVGRDTAAHVRHGHAGAGQERVQRLELGGNDCALRQGRGHGDEAEIRQGQGDGGRSRITKLTDVGRGGTRRCPCVQRRGRQQPGAQEPAEPAAHPQGGPTSAAKPPYVHPR